MLLNNLNAMDFKHHDLTFQLMVEAFPNALLLVNKFGVISLVNKQTEVIFGYKRKELIGQKIEILIPNPFGNNHSPHLNKFLKKPQTRAMGVGRDLFAKRKDCTIFPVEIGLNPVEILNENMVIASVVDISERKKIELKNKELEQFTYIASHDLQEPLNTVMSFINLVEDNSGHKFSELDKKSFKYINEATFRMKGLIKGLLNYGRLGKKSEIKKVDCHKLVHYVCEDLSSLIKSTGANIHIEQLPTINAYKTEIRLLFQNLLENAMKFQKNDTCPEIYISVEKDDSNYKFSIKDNGIGIDQKYKHKIFTIFQKLHERNKYEGSGIGLAHCKKIVELHNGELWFDSQIGLGSTFHFTIKQRLLNYEKN